MVNDYYNDYLLFSAKVSIIIIVIIYLFGRFFFFLKFLYDFILLFKQYFIYLIINFSKYN